MSEDKALSPEDKNVTNLASKMKKEDREKIGREVCENYDTDKKGRSSWEDKRNRWYKLWLMERDPKTEPFPGCSNICTPLLAVACNQFHGRSYQAFFSPPKIVKSLPVAPNDVERALRVEDLMNWQTMYEMEEFEEEQDKLLLSVPINGHAFKKTYYDSVKERPVSEFVSAMDIYLPYRTKNLESARRITHALFRHYDEWAVRNQKKGFYVDFDKVNPEAGVKPSEEIDATKDKTETESSQSSEDPKLFLESHCYLKLKDDDFPKPYIATVDYDSQTLLRLTSREMKVGGDIVVANYFTDYGFIPNPEGYYHLGFGHFLEVLNEMANTAFNQIFDAGRLSNQPFGFYGRRLGIKKRELKLWPGKMEEVEDASQVFFPNMQRVDQVLFQVLGMIQQHAEQFTSTSDYLLGREAKGVKTPTATGTLAIIEQGLIQYTVLTKRLFRSFKKELQKVYEVDQLYLPENKQYRVFGGDGELAFPKVKRADFNGKLDIIPVGDPSYASKLARKQEAAEVFQMMLANPLVVTNPKIQVAAPEVIRKVTQNLLETFERKDLVNLLPKPPKPMLDPEYENAMFIQGDTVDPQQGEPHPEHLRVHLGFRNSPFYADMRDEYKILFEKHIAKTKSLLMQEIQMRTKMQGLQQPPGAQPPVQQPPAQQPPMQQPPAQQPPTEEPPVEEETPPPEEEEEVGAVPLS